MAGIHGNVPRKLVPKALTANLTVTGYDLKSKWNTYINTGSNTYALTLPSPIKDLAKVEVYLVNVSSGAFTISCSSGFVGGGSTFVLDASNSATLVCLPTNAAGSTYAWSVQGAAQAIAGLSETIADVVGSMVTGNTESNITVTYQDADNTLDFSVSGMTVASTDVTDWAEAVQDTVGAFIGTASTHLGNTCTYTDGSGTLAIDSNSIQYKCTALTGGAAGALDAIDGTGLTVDGQIAMVEASKVVYFYKLNTTGGAGESSPTVIVPDDNAGTINWELCAQYNTAANVTGIDEYIQDTVGAMFTSNTETGIAASYEDSDGTVDLVVAYGATSDTACEGDDARLPVDTTTWAASAVWSGGAPASVTEVYRYAQINDRVFFNADLSGADGDAKTLTSISLPVAPADVNMQVACAGYQLIDATWTQVFAYVDAEDGTEGNRILKFRNSLECTDGAAFRIIVSGNYEV